MVPTKRMVAGCSHSTKQTFFSKIMLLYSVGRPHHRPNGTFFDGLLGIWPFAIPVPTKSRLRNREAGPVELEPVKASSGYFKGMMV